MTIGTVLEESFPNSLFHSPGSKEHIGEWALLHWRLHLFRQQVLNFLYEGFFSGSPWTFIHMFKMTNIKPLAGMLLYTWGIKVIALFKFTIYCGFLVATITIFCGGILLKILYFLLAFLVFLFCLFCFSGRIQT